MILCMFIQCEFIEQLSMQILSHSDLNATTISQYHAMRIGGIIYGISDTIPVRTVFFTSLKPSINIDFTFQNPFHFIKITTPNHSLPRNQRIPINTVQYFHRESSRPLKPGAGDSCNTQWRLQIRIWMKCASCPTNLEGEQANDAIPCHIEMTS